MDRLARITILEPYGPPGKPQRLELKYGFGEAHVMSASGDIVPGIIASDDVVDAGAHLGLMQRSITRTIPGRPNAWVLEYGNKQLAQALVPLDAARLWFGDDRIPMVAAMGTPPEMTYNFERNRVATRWGGWRMPQRALNGRNACTKGENDFDATKIGPPRVPKVRIEKMDTSGQVSGEPFEPWAWFDWGADVDVTHPELAAGALSDAKALSATALAGFSLSDLEAFVNAKRAAEAGAVKSK